MKLVLTVAVVYVAVVIILYFAQTKLLFPAGLAGGRIDLPETAERLRLDTPDGTRLEGVRLPAQKGGAGAFTLLLFGGNAWNAEEGAVLFHQLLPQADIIAFHYRGYGPSGGTPSTAAIREDAVRIYDHIAERDVPRPMIAAGLSLGAGPAAYLASRRPVAGLVLVTPFDSLTKLAKHHYFWVPVRVLLRHRLPVLKFTRAAEVPIGVIVAGRDRVVPAARSAAFGDLSNMVLHRAIAEAGHNDLYDRPEFATAFRQAVSAIRHTVTE